MVELRLRILELNPRHARIGIVQGGGFAGVATVERRWLDALIPDAEPHESYTVEVRRKEE